MKFESSEEIERWFKDWKYEVEVHNAIEFILKENKNLKLSAQLYRENFNTNNTR